MRPDRLRQISSACRAGALVVVLSGCIGAAASGQGLEAADAPNTGTGPGLAFTLGTGVAIEPEYFGSDDYEAGPAFSFSPQFLRLPGGRSFGSPDPDAERYGFGLRGSVRYIGERDASDANELEGLDDVDPAFELGGGLEYRLRNFEAFADLRYGVVGHDSFVGEVGANVVARPTDRLRLAAGPRVLLADDGYASTYFGVSDDEAADSDLEAFSAGGGVLSAGVELGARYRINDKWGLEGSVSYDRLTGDAADSPITELGSRDQYRATIGVTRRFSLGF